LKGEGHTTHTHIHFTPPCTWHHLPLHLPQPHTLLPPHHTAFPTHTGTSHRYHTYLPADTHAHAHTTTHPTPPHWFGLGRYALHGCLWTGRAALHHAGGHSTCSGNMARLQLRVTAPGCLFLTTSPALPAGRRDGTRHNSTRHNAARSLVLPRRYHHPTVTSTGAGIPYLPPCEKPRISRGTFAPRIDSAPSPQHTRRRDGGHYV